MLKESVLQRESEREKESEGSRDENLLEAVEHNGTE